MGRQRQRQRQRRSQQQGTRAPQQRAGSGGGRRPPARPVKRSSSANRWGIGIGVLIVLLAVVGLIYGVAHGYNKSASSPTATAVPTAAATSTSVAQSLAKPVDGVQCGAMEQLAYHIHQHIALYNHGKYVSLPPEIGIPGGEAYASCYYWIHVHQTTPNIIHVESPIKKIFPLGDLFDIWVATSSTVPGGDGYVKALRAAAAKGQVTAYLNGKRWQGNYRSIPLKAHAVITVEIGTPLVKPRPFNQWGSL